MPTSRPPDVVRSRVIVHRLLFSACLACALAGPAMYAQQAPPQTSQAGSQQAAEAQQGQQPPAFRAGVNFVRVDVHPTQDGRPVTDLTQDDFELLEDGVRQELRSFERVVIRAPSPLDTRIEPRNAAEANQMAASSRARLFVLFLDTYHIQFLSAANAKTALVQLLERTLGPDDLVAVMTPEMGARTITFTRRPESIEELLGRLLTWGRRGQELDLDPTEQRYVQCYPSEDAKFISPTAREMIARRREGLVLDAMEDLILHLEGLREERKAIFMVTEGWPLYRPNSELARSRDGRIPGPPAVGVGPDGRLRTGTIGRDFGEADLSRCDQDRFQFAQEDHDRRFRDLTEVANRGNSSFYPIDPRGLPVFDASIESREPNLRTGGIGAIGGGRDSLDARHNSMRILAANTDGLAIMNSNDIEGHLQQVVEDLSSYYLLGYASSNSKADGKFRSITVRVKRPGVAVRARRGYRAPTREEADGRAAMAAAPAAATPATKAVDALTRVRDVAFVRSRLGYEWRPSSDGRGLRPALWLVVELDPSAGSREPAWKEGSDVSFTVTNLEKKVVGQGTERITREGRAFLWRLTPEQGMVPGDYAVRITAKPAGAMLGTTETLRILVPKPPGEESFAAGQPLLLRRGPFTGTAWLPAGDPRYRRQERVKVEVPVAGSLTSAETKLLDRFGKPLSTIPVVSSDRQENGLRLVGGEVTLAPLAAGDYILETTLTQGDRIEKIVVAFRIIP